jgi:NADH-quinone oxidoreductase subunit H
VIALAQAGVSVFDSTFSNFWLVLIIKVVAVVGFFLVAPLAVGYTEHKVLAHMQARYGPMEAGGFHGWAQLVADGVKFIQKEDIVPQAADRAVFSLAPAVAMVPYIVLFVVIPFSPTLFAVNLDLGVFFLLAISSVSVIGTLMAGWSSANKFSLIGALRAAAQLIAYELPLVLAAAAIVMQAGTMSLVGITEAQAPAWYILSQPIGFLIFMTAALAEYTGLKFAFFLLAEYGGIVALSAIASVLYLGGYRALPGLSAIPPPFWMLAKIGALSFVVIWLRATYPRLREDQLQRFAWLALIPLALVQIMVVAILVVAF